MEKEPNLKTKLKIEEVKDEKGHTNKGKFGN
jgi:hypothetical protein